jgi:hypothetical protein
MAAAGYGEAGDLHEAAGDERGGGVVAEVEAGDDTGGERDDVLKRAAEFSADDVVVAVDAQRGGTEVVLQALAERVVCSGDGDGGGQGGGDPCAKDGPPSTAMGLGQCCAMTWDMRRAVVSSTPLAAESSTWVGVSAGAISSMTERRDCEGVAQRMMSASRMASSRRAVTRTSEGRAKPGR